MPSTLCARCHKDYTGRRCNCSRNVTESMTTSERGYDSTWRKLSEQKRKLNPLCEGCEADDKVEPATQVHHIVPISVDPSLRLKWSNLMSLCDACHEAKHGGNL